MNETTLRRPPREVPSLWEATLDVFDAGQQLIIDRIELVRAEISEDILRLAVGASFVVAAGVLALIGYLTLLAAVIVFLADVLSPAAALAIGGAFHTVLGVALAAMGVSSLRRMRLTMPRRTAESHLGEEHHA